MVEHTSIHAEDSDTANSKPSAGNEFHSKHCFVVMPFGRDREEKKWFRGWYEVVIEPAVSSCGYHAILSAAEEQPGAINDEIRAHLVYDPMVVVDLGGIEPNAAPNPNVMYELGIRHAFGLPLVVMAWEGQVLPFDVGNQRAIMTGRGLLDLEPTREKLVSFIRAAEDNRFYNPMTAVGREATIDAASYALGEESLLGALAEEVRELRRSLSRTNTIKGRKNPKKKRIKYALGKQLKSELWGRAQDLGLNSNEWSKFLNSVLAPDTFADAKSWSLDEWIEYLEMHKPAYVSPQVTSDSLQSDEIKLTPDFIEQVAMLLPEQPWEAGVHRDVADKLQVSNTLVSKAIQNLIGQGRVYHQSDGQLFKLIEASDKGSNQSDVHATSSPESDPILVDDPQSS